MKTNIDNKIPDFFTTLEDILPSLRENSDEDIKYFIKLLPTAIKYKIVPILYELHVYGNTRRINSKLFGNRILSKKQKIIYFIRFCLFSIKSLLFYRKIISQNKIIANVGCERNISKFYLEAMEKLAKKNNSIVISFNVPCTFKYLFNKHIFYYYSYNFIKSEKKLTLNRISNVILDEIKKNSSLQDLSYIKNNICVNVIFLFREYLKSEKFLNKFRSNIFGLIQDYDYSYNKYIYVELFKKYNISTFSFQHAINFYNHLYPYIYSDHYLVWGQQELNRAREKNSSLNISIVGYPKGLFNVEVYNNGKRNILYFLSSHDFATSQTEARQLDYVNLIIEKIKNSLLNYDEQLELILIPHPQDNPSLYKGNKVKICNKNIESLLSQAKLLVFEDTTAIFNYMLMEIPILYINDENNNDPLLNKEFNSISSFYNGEDMNEKIDNSMKLKVDLEKRKKHFEYFFRSANQEDYINQIHNKIKRN